MIIGPHENPGVTISSFLMMLHFPRGILLPCITSCFAEATQLYGQVVSFNKRERFHQSTLEKENRLTNITTEVTDLKEVHWFTYLGCPFASDVRINKEVDNWLTKASSAFGRLY